MEKLYSVSEAAQKLGGIAVSTIRAWVSQGRLTKTKVGRRTMISQQALENFIRSGQLSPASSATPSEQPKQK